MYQRILFIIVCYAGISLEGMKDDKESALFLRCWDIYLESYIKECAPNVNNNTQDFVSKWTIKFKQFQERLAFIRPLFVQWDKKVGAIECLKKMTIFDALKSCSLEYDNADYYGQGSNHWLLVALGLLPEYEYVTKEPNNEIQFLIDNKGHCQSLGIDIVRSDKGINIKTKFPFFSIEFFKKNIRFEHSISRELLIKRREKEEQDFNVLSKEDRALAFENNCVMLIPGITSLLDQNHFRTIYSRLIQYALVSCMGKDSYKNALKLKIVSLYKGSWIDNPSVMHLHTQLWYPYSSDPVDEMTRRKEIISFLQKMDSYKGIHRNDFSKDMKFDLSKDIQVGEDNKNGNRFERIVYSHYSIFLKGFLQIVTAIFPNEKKSTEEIIDQQERFKIKWNERNHSVNNWNVFTEFKKDN